MGLLIFYVSVCWSACQSVCISMYVPSIGRFFFVNVSVIYMVVCLSVFMFIYQIILYFLSMYCTYASLSVFTRVYTCTYLTGEMSTSMTILLLSGGNPQSSASIMT